MYTPLGTDITDIMLAQVQSVKQRAGSIHAPIYICSNHAFFVQHVNELLQADNRLAIQFQQGDQLQNGGIPGVLVVDVCSTPNWVEVADQWHSGRGETIIVVASQSWFREDSVHALSIGVRGIVEISRNFDQLLLEAIRSVATGGLWVSRETTSECISRLCLISKSARKTSSCFTGRESQILFFLRSGFSNKEIGHNLGISERTVKFHVSNILEKARVGSRKALIDRRPQTQVTVSTGSRLYP